MNEKFKAIFNRYEPGITASVFTQYILPVIWAVLLAGVSYLLPIIKDVLHLGVIMGSNLIATIAYASMFIVASLVLFGIARGPVAWAWNKARSVSQKSEWKLVPRDFGVDSQGRHFIGFRIAKPKGEFNAQLKMFWCSGLQESDEMQLRYSLNVTSFRLRRTSDGQFMLVVATATAIPFSLALDDGFYGLFSVNGFYKARIGISHNGNNETCFDVLIRHSGRANIEIVEIKQIDCDDPLDHIADKNDDSGSRNWSTVPDFQPNLMYRGN